MQVPTLTAEARLFLVLAADYPSLPSSTLLDAIAHYTHALGLHGDDPWTRAMVDLAIRGRLAEESPTAVGTAAAPEGAGHAALGAAAR
ncbi:MAG: hypothetical protein ACT4P1_00315 [Sporichthyaceae bacterium]